jgi:hypothetical protein
MFALMLCLWAAPASGDGLVIVSLSSPSTGAVVPPGHLIEWTITATVSTGDNVGLALISVDLVRDPRNPMSFDLAPAMRPFGMEGFDRPGGLCNPGRDGRPSGYGGTQVGNSGGLDLAQIGGAQNTFGVPGVGWGEDVDVDAHIGQYAGGQIVAAGAFAAPPAPGVYRFSIQSAIANTLRSVQQAPAASPVSAAEVSTDPAEISFTVCRPGDLDGDGVISIEYEIPIFVDFLLGTRQRGDAATCTADMNNDGILNGDDVQPFVNALLSPLNDVDWNPTEAEQQGP